MDAAKVKEIEARIADLKARWPAHSVKPYFWQRLEELEAELEAAVEEERNETQPDQRNRRQREEDSGTP